MADIKSREKANIYNLLMYNKLAGLLEVLVCLYCILHQAGWYPTLCRLVSYAMVAGIKSREKANRHGGSLLQTGIK